VGKRYRIEGRLGLGSTADVYLTVDTRLGRPVVVKQLTQNASENDELRSRFLSEAHALSQLCHPNIVRVLDFGAPLDERPYLVMEALHGETLAALLSRRAHQPVEISLMIAQQTAFGLEAAHRAQVFHRDVKPDNLFLVGPCGAPFGVKIIDFGMAKIPRSNGSSGVHTVLGTVEYMAPEQVMADPVDARTDIYGLGILLFRLFTAHLPFEAPLGLDLLSHQLFSPVPPASWINDELDPRLERVVTRATRKHPANRYQSMTQLLADLHEAMSASGTGPMSQPLVTDPDVYEPQNPKGREVAELLAARYQTIAPARYAQSEREAALSQVTFRTEPPGTLERPQPELQSEPLTELRSGVDADAWPTGHR
jgi:serine/threonine-protein kinase